MNKESCELTPDLLRRYFSYDPNTGEFLWKEMSAKRIRVGSIAGRTDEYGHRNLTLRNRHYQAHRVAWLFAFGSWPKGVIDHINGIRDDNRIANLRDVSIATNSQNQKRPTSKNKYSDLIGCGYNPRMKKWYSRIWIAGKQVHLGLFDDKLVAHQAYLAAKRIHHEGCTI